MPDIITEVSLPSNGKLYKENVQWKNTLRAPRLKDKGLGDSTRKNKLQAETLDKTLLQPLGMSTYDLHTADFLYLNMKQRQLSKGAVPYKVSITCPNQKCKHQINLSVRLEDLEVKKLQEPLDLHYKTLNDEELILTYFTPRMFDECVDKAQEYQDEYPENGLSFEQLKTQELLRFVIVKVNGERLTEAQMSEFIQNMYDDDVTGIFDYLNSFDFGIQFLRETTCPKCGKKIKYLVPAG